MTPWLEHFIHVVTDLAIHLPLTVYSVECCTSCLIRKLQNGSKNLRHLFSQPIYLFIVAPLGP